MACSITTTTDEVTTPTTDPHVKTQIRTIIQNFLSTMQIPFIIRPYAHDFHELCCKIAEQRGYPMGTDPCVPSLLPLIKLGVCTASVMYAHIEDEATRVFVCFYTAFLGYVDDTSRHDIEHVSVFIERFIHRQKQLDPVLDGLASLLLTIPDFYEPLVANIVLTGALNLINASALEFETKEMKLSSHAKDYAEFTRQLSGANEAYTVMAFPRHISIQRYIQCLPYAGILVGNLNDVASFYKEELAHETNNYISIFARCHGIEKMVAFEQLADIVAGADAQVCKILEEADDEVRQVWQRFRTGFIDFHTSLDRYRLKDLMECSVSRVQEQGDM